ncbi:MAG: GGDEF/EAL domain-containing response regulator, partial [Geminicoccaceae bacterium]
MSVEGDIRVTSFSSAEPAQGWFSEASSDLVIIDLQTPDIDGAAFVQAFRALPGAGDIPLMVIASEEQRDDCHRLLDAGATDFLLRPVDQTEFKVRARNLLTMREQQRKLRSAVTAEPGETTSPTDLPNRGVYRKYLENALMQALRREARCAILVINLDRFKGVNDAFGLSFGDCLLKAVASRLAQHLGEINVVGHLGGDQFAVLQTDINGRDESRRLATQLKERLSKSFVIGGEELHISASLGITMFPADGYKADRLLRNAELAMHRAKAIGRNAICFYAPKMNFVARRTGLLERELRQAVADDQFTVHYQPCQAIRDDRILGMEALLRWRHPRRGMVRPTEFIGIAETIGLINAITECVLEQSCRQHRLWIEEGLPPLRLAVNLSPIQFREEGIVDLVKTMLERTGIAPETLEIELTEG